MGREQELSDLIGYIYDCAIDPTLWKETLPRVASFMDSRTVNVDIVTRVPGGPPLVSLLEHGFPSEAWGIYYAKYMDKNPLVPLSMLYDIGEVFSSREAVDREFFEQRDGLYLGWCVPFGFLEMITGIIRKDEAGAAAISVTRHKPYDDTDRAKLKFILPHVRRSLTIADLIDRRTVERDRFQEIIENLSAAVFLVDASGRLFHSNRAARQILAEGRILFVHNGRLTPFDDDLRAALADPDGKPHPVALTAASSKGRVATILPLASGYRREVSGTAHVCAAIFLHDPAAAAEIPGETLRQLFDLTGAEVRVLLALAEGASPQEIADRFHASIATVRTHMRRLFEKTGTARQGELIRKVLRLMSPVAG